jgi:hypothetical protein
MTPRLFKPSAYSILESGLNAMTKACEAQELLIGVVKTDLAASELRCEELITRNNQLEERHNLNKGEVE